MSRWQSRGSTLKRMQDQVRGNIVKAQAIRMQYQGKSEGMNGQEETEYVRLIEEADAIKPKIESALKFLALKSWADGAASGLPAGGAGEAAVTDADKREAKHKHLYRDYLRGQSKQAQFNLERFAGKPRLAKRKRTRRTTPKAAALR